MKLPAVIACETLPPGMMLRGGSVFINVGERSPDWVNQLDKTEAGRRMLCRIVEGLLLKGGWDVVCEEGAEADTDDEGDNGAA